jgi:hypothetical protein
MGWVRWTAGTGWVAQSNVPVAGMAQQIRSMQIEPYRDQAKLMAVFSDKDADLRSATYNNSTWTVSPVLNANLSTAQYRNFSFTIPGPLITTAVTLASFEAHPVPSGVELSWRTASELDNLGFHLHRAPSEAGPWTRLTTSLVLGLGSSPVGASYSYLDAGLVPGQRYYYLLEDIDTKSVSTFHGPVTALVPLPLPPAEDGGAGAGGGSAGAGTESAGEGCPAWLISSIVGLSTPVRCTPHGAPDAVSLSVLSRTARSLDLELRTGGFWSVVPTGSGSPSPEGLADLRAYVPGFDTPTDPRSLALPLRRALVDAAVGRQVRLVSVEAVDERRFPGLRPSLTGRPDVALSGDGTIRPVRRSEGRSSASSGFSPSGLARLAGAIFQGERKSAVLELTPLRYDGGTGDLVLATRVRVRLLFTGVEPGETGTGSVGRRTRLEATPDVLAQLHTTSRGIHRARFEEVFPGRVRGLGTTLLRLQRYGEAVPFHVEPRGDSFGPGSVLYFYADREARSTDFTGDVAYELVRSGDGQPMETVGGAPEGPVATASLGFLSQEVNRIYQSGLLEADDPWLWEALPSPSVRMKTLTLAGVDAGSPASGQIAVFLQGASESGTVVDHHVRVALNGTVVGEARFAGKVPYRFEAPVPATLLREGTNEVQVESVGDTGVTSLVFLDRFELRYPLVPAARGGLFEGLFAEGGTGQVEGLAGLPVVLDVAPDGSAPRWVVGSEVAGSSVRWRVEAGRRYLVATGEGVRRPRVVRPPASTLRSAANRADYLLIAPEAFLPAAEPLLLHRESQGLAVKGVSLEEIAREFGHGQPSGEAIRTFVGHAYHPWAKPSVRYVVLVGDTTYDPRRFSASTTMASPLPALWGKTSWLLTAKDPVLGAVNGEDEVPDVAVGRIPATTLEQAQLLIGKLLAWEGSGQGIGGKALLVADDADAAGDFEWDVEDVRASFLGDREAEVLKVGQLGAGTRPAIQATFDGGPGLVSYVGHGGSAVWASENVWNSWDAPSLRAQSRQPLLLTMNCLNGYFVGTNFESLSESMLKAEGRGAIAAISPSGLSVDGPAHQYHRAVMAELTGGGHERPGDAVLAAQQAYAETGLMPELLSVYHLFGDPALRIR